MKPSDYIRKGFCKNAFARDAHDREVGCGDDNACSWCVLGAIRVATPPDLREGVEKMMRKRLDVWDLAEWNDAAIRTQAEVIAALEAIGQ